jgi:hypothetical protein
MLTSAMTMEDPGIGYEPISKRLTDNWTGNRQTTVQIILRDRDGLVRRRESGGIV